MSNDPPKIAVEAALKPSSSTYLTKETVSGYDFNQGVNYRALLETYKTTGFQATNFGLAVEEIKKMISKRKEPLAEDARDEYENDEFVKRKTNCTIFLGYTSNMVSSGIRDTIRYLVQHRMVDCIVTSAGGVEEDIIKCLAATYLGDFSLKGSKLRDAGINRIGNLLVPNDNYCKFEDWLMPLLDKLLEEQKSNGVIWSPSKIISRLGEEVNNPDSICYWAAKNKIPIFCPALTDGSLGDMIYFHSYRNPGLIVDIAQDIRRLNTIAVKAINSGMIIIGGSVVKHHICNANMMRNGADYAVFINTGLYFDGSDSGAHPDEAVSWGKIKKDATPVKMPRWNKDVMESFVKEIGTDFVTGVFKHAGVYADATLVFPLLVAETFAQYIENIAAKGK